MQWYYISLPSMTFGIASCNGVVQQTAPIAKWTRGKSIDSILVYYARKHATIVRLPDEN